MNNLTALSQDFTEDEETNFITNPNLNKKFNIDPPLNLAVLASGKGSNFEAINRAIKIGKLDAKINLLIVNNKDCLARKKASDYGIHCEYIDHRKFQDRNTYDESIVNTLKKFDIDTVIMAGWMRIVTSTLINAFPDRIINIHPSLLPSFKGGNAINQALLAGVKITGCTAHKVIKEVDSGEILAQAAIKITKDDNLETLTKKIQEQEHKILPYAISILGSYLR